MNTANVISISGRRRVARAIDARRVLETTDRRRGGRAWVNGRELGEPRASLKHLSYRHD